MPRFRTKNNQGRKQRSFWQKVKDKGLTLPGYNYLGPFNAKHNGIPTNASDRTAQEHDDGYELLQKQGVNPYLTYNDADEVADAKWGDDIGGRIAKSVFRGKKRLAEWGLLSTDTRKISKSNVALQLSNSRHDPVDTISKRKRSDPTSEGVKRIKQTSKRFQALLQDVRNVPVSNLRQAAQAPETMSGGGGDGSGLEAGLKETPIDDVWNVTRGPPEYTFASLPYMVTRVNETTALSTDLIIRMTSPYDPNHSVQTVDTNTGAGVSNEIVATSTDATIRPARWYSYYSSQYRYYHTVACRWHLMIENMSLLPIWVHIMYRNDDAPPQSATNEDIRLWPGTKSFYVGPMGYAIETDGNAQTQVTTNSEMDETDNIGQGQNYQANNHIAGGASNIMKTSDEYRHGDYNREIRLDSQVENWTRVDANPALPERLFIRVKPDNLTQLNAAANQGSTIKYKVTLQADYLTEFKELAYGLRYPVQRQPAYVTIQQDTAAGVAAASEAPVVVP